MTVGINSSKNTAIALVRGRVYLWSACLPAALVPWVSGAIVALRLIVLTAVFSAKAVSQKPAVHVALKPPSSG
ncbi:hypothetical protein ArsFIN_42600 (plasmid) [Arsenophonus nasoniae]|uniref:Uncharacterized protein n=1 Tax=Arsenophonus nasoniae TaxID=638 RepID=A0A4P7KYZ4_9GAMM|nr:hypothetical protein ArsFIN_42600 [Arsenophonus nasoniae]